MVAPCACAALLLGGCGGGRRADAGEPSRTFTVEIVKATFSPKQSIAKPTAMRLEIRNADSRTIPNLAVTVDSFYYTSTYRELAADKRPIWVVERGPGRLPEPPVQSEAVSPPGGGQTAYVNTWALGPLAAGHTQTFEWKVAPVKAGTYTVHVKVAAGLAGRARAAFPGGGAPGKAFTAQIAPAPPATHVNPNTGRVTGGSYPGSGQP